MNRFNQILVGSKWQRRGGNKKLGQAALEYALTTVVMALIASLLYLVYQPLVYNVFFPVDVTDHSTGLTKKDPGMGMRDLMYLPIP